MKLTETTETLVRQTHDPHVMQRDGVTFSSPAHHASSVQIDFTRWMDMGLPEKILLTITPMRDRRS